MTEETCVKSLPRRRFHWQIPALWTTPAWMRPPRARLLILGLFGASVGCNPTTDTTATTTTSVVETVTATSVTLGPEAFLGQVPCSNAAGALRSYVATLTDITQGEDGKADLAFDLPSSAPIPCSNRAIFRYIVADHAYGATLEGYDLDASELAPLSPGSRTMLRKADQTPVVPRWKAACDPVITSLDENVAFSDAQCSKLQDQGSSLTGIKVIPTASLGLLACGGKDGLASFNISPTAPALPPLLGVACEGGVAEYTQGIEPGATYTFNLDAYTAEGKKFGSSSCAARTREGLTVIAACAPLTRLPPSPP